MRDQTVRCVLGEQVVLSYSRTPDCRDQISIGIGRPPSRPGAGRNNVHPNHLMHDIRTLNVAVVVFSVPGRTRLRGRINRTQTTIRLRNLANVNPTGNVLIGREIISYTGINQGNNELTGCARGTNSAAHAIGARVWFSTSTPAASAAEVAADLLTLNERYAQATIRLNANPTVNLGTSVGTPPAPVGVPLPGALLRGFRRTEGIVANATDSENALVPLKNAGANTVTIFYVEKVFKEERPASSIKATAYPAVKNGTRNTNFKNFLVMGQSRWVLSISHEMMHVLRNSPHRDGDPRTSLLHPSRGRNDKATSRNKRAGPYAALNNADTRFIRNSVLTLP